MYLSQALVLSSCLILVYSDFLNEIRVKFFKNNTSFIDERALTVNIFLEANEIVIEDQKIQILRTGTFQNLSLLRIVKIQQCQLEKIEKQAFMNLPQLKIINLNFNNLKVVNESVFSNLGITQLSIIGNGIETIAKNAFANLTDLEVLNLSSNNIEKLDVNMFPGTTNLRQIDFSYNKIAVLPNNLLRNIFSGNNFNSLISFSHNQLTYITSRAFQGVYSVEELKLDNNLIEQLGHDCFSESFYIGSVNLEGNRLRSLSVSVLKSFVNSKEIKLEGNPWIEVFLEKYWVWCKTHEKINTISFEYNVVE